MRIRTILIVLLLILGTSNLKAQTDTITISFTEFYKVWEDGFGKTQYDILLDSTYHQEENLHFVRILNLGDREDLAQQLVPHQTYSVVVHRKVQSSTGCKGAPLLNFRSNRATTDAGTLFGSDFLTQQLAMQDTCERIAIEYYYIEEIITD